MLCGKPPFLFTGICLYCMLCGKPPFLFTGICLYCMLCGTLPYRDDDIDVLRNAMTEKLKFVKQVSKGNLYFFLAHLTLKILFLTLLSIYHRRL